MQNGAPSGKSREMVLNCFAKSAVLKPGLESGREAPAPGWWNRQPALDFCIGDIMVALRHGRLLTLERRQTRSQHIAEANGHPADAVPRGALFHNHGLTC